MRPTVGLGTLRQLRELASDREPVLSVYVDLDDDRFPTRAPHDAALHELLARAGVDGEEADRARPGAHRAELAYGAHGLAIFSAPQSGVLETVALPSHVKPLAVLDTAPWLEPLVEMVTAEDSGVMVLSRRVARLFRGGPRALVAFATVADETQDGQLDRPWPQLPRKGCLQEHIGPTSAARRPRSCCAPTSSGRSITSSLSSQASSGPRST